MSDDTLEEAMKYAERDPLWLDRPVFQQRHIKVLAAEVSRLRELANSSENTRRDLPKWGPKSADHPTIGSKCPACNLLFNAGDYTTAIIIGPGVDVEARKAAIAGEQYNGVALEVHWACATGEEP